MPNPTPNQQVDKTSGGENTPWRGNWTESETSLFFSLSLSLPLVFVFQDLLRGELNAVCATLRFFFSFPPIIRLEWKS